jgi:AcrR family transcriptional regulator
LPPTARNLLPMTSTPTRPRGEYAKTAARRDAIVAAALEVFAASGYAKGSLRDVAERAGLSQAGLLHHYPSKVHLIEAVLAWHDEQSVRIVRAAGRDGADPLAALVALAEHNQANPAMVELYVSLSAEATSPDHPVHEHFRRRYDAAVELFRVYLGRQAESGLLRPDSDPASTARSLIAFMDGLQVQWLYDRSSVDMAVEVRRFLDVLTAARAVGPVGG